jgi:hypothetical protein
MKAFENIARWQIKKSIIPECQNKTSIEEGLGIALAHHFEWDGIGIMKTMMFALEDANFHTEAGIVGEWLDKNEYK